MAIHNVGMLSTLFLARISEGEVGRRHKSAPVSTRYVLPVFLSVMGQVVFLNVWEMPAAVNDRSWCFPGGVEQEECVRNCTLPCMSRHWCRTWRDSGKLVLLAEVVLLLEVSGLLGVLLKHLSWSAAHGIYFEVISGLVVLFGLEGHCCHSRGLVVLFQYEVGVFAHFLHCASGC